MGRAWGGLDDVRSPGTARTAAKQLTVRLLARTIGDEQTCPGHERLAERPQACRDVVQIAADWRVHRIRTVTARISRDVQPKPPRERHLLGRHTAGGCVHDDGEG